jgi:hypothetical protein
MSRDQVQQHISSVSAGQGAQLAVGNFHGDVHFGNTEDPQSMSAISLMPVSLYLKVVTDLCILNLDRNP